MTTEERTQTLFPAMIIVAFGLMVAGVFAMGWLNSSTQTGWLEGIRRYLLDNRIIGVLVLLGTILALAFMIWLIHHWSSGAQPVAPIPGSLAPLPGLNPVPVAPLAPLAPLTPVSDPLPSGSKPPEGLIDKLRGPD